jgi:hypothetical protein
MWITKAWQHISPEVTVTGFKCCISKGMDGPDYEMFWNDSEEDGVSECKKAQTVKMERVTMIGKG